MNNGIRPKRTFRTANETSNGCLTCIWSFSAASVRKRIAWALFLACSSFVAAVSDGVRVQVMRTMRSTLDARWSGMVMGGWVGDGGGNKMMGTCHSKLERTGVPPQQTLGRLELDFGLFLHLGVAITF